MRVGTTEAFGTNDRRACLPDLDGEGKAPLELLCAGHLHKHAVHPLKNRGHRALVGVLVLMAS